jgi:hypothetical protein
MTKTTSTLLAFGALAAAFSYLAIDSTDGGACKQVLAWEQPPIVAPRPGTDIIILRGSDSVRRDQLAWEQPPIQAPRPGTDIIILKGVEASATATA